MRWKVFAPALLIPLPAAMCTTTRPPQVPTIQTVTVTKEVQRPCAVTKPARPAALAKPLPSDLEQLAAVLGAKLEEYAAPGAYADRADAAISTCTKP